VTALTVLGSIVDALREVGAQNVALASPYTDDQNDALATYLEEQGFVVAGWQGLDQQDSLAIASEDPRTAYRLGRELVSACPDADTLLLSCGNLRTFEVLEALQWDTGLEVVSSNQAALWNALRTVGVGEPVRGFGRLLERKRLSDRQQQPHV
jgi:maleate isomerase